MSTAQTLLFKIIVTCIFLAVMACSSETAAPPQTSVFPLENGIRVVVVQFPESENVSIMTFLPMGLAFDGPDRAQWSHLVEHMVIKSTGVEDFKVVNAETLPDHMRLDFMGTRENWREGLSHHARWLEGAPFPKQILKNEIQKANSECDFTAKRFATHKFAMAAWAQGYRHGLKHAAVKGDLARASLADIRQYRDARLVVLDKAVVCVIGALSADEARPFLAKRLGAIRSTAKVPAPVQVHPGKREMTWDLQARHLVLTWPIPSPGEKDHAALMAAAQMLNMRLFTDSELKPLVGMALAGADLETPEGCLFQISVSLKSDVSFDKVLSKIRSHLKALQGRGIPRKQMEMMGPSLAQQLSAVQDPSLLQGQMPSGVSPAMIEGNIGLQWGMAEFRYGAERAALVRNLNALTADDIRKAAGAHLAFEKASTCLLKPRPKPFAAK